MTITEVNVTTRDEAYNAMMQMEPGETLSLAHGITLDRNKRMFLAGFQDLQGEKAHDEYTVRDLATGYVEDLDGPPHYSAITLAWYAQEGIPDYKRDPQYHGIDCGGYIRCAGSQD